MDTHVTKSEEANTVLGIGIHDMTQAIQFGQAHMDPHKLCYIQAIAYYRTLQWRASVQASVPYKFGNQCKH